MIRILTNLTDHEFTLDDFLGKLVQIGESFDALIGGEDILKNSASIVNKLLDNSLKLNDGSQDWYGMDAINIIIASEIPPVTTSDGKPIVATRDRPEGTFSQMVGCGDDIETGEIGAGPEFILQLAPSDTNTVYVDMQYCTNVWIRGGSIRYKDAQFGTHINLYAVAPAGVPYPTYNNDGSLDYDIVSKVFVPNVNNTGKFKINMTNDVIFDRFFSKKMLLGDDIDDIMLSDPHHMIVPYYMRMELVVPTGEDIDLNKVCKVVATQIIYREKTLTNEIVLNA